MNTYHLFVLQEKPVCEDCLKWKQFGDQCHVYWENKKFCTLKVKNNDEWDEEKRRIGN